MRNGSALEEDRVLADGSDEFFAFLYDLRTSAPIGYQKHGVDYRKEWNSVFPPLTMNETTELTARLGGTLACSGNNQIVVAWSDSPDALMDMFECETDNVLYAAPLSCGLFLASVPFIGLDRKAQLQTPGWMVVSEKVLSHYLRMMAVHMFHHSNWSQDRYVLPHVTRKRQIEKLVSRHSQLTNPSESFAKLFPSVYSALPRSLELLTSAKGSSAEIVPVPPAPNGEPGSSGLLNLPHAETFV